MIPVTQRIFMRPVTTWVSTAGATGESGMCPRQLDRTKQTRCGWSTLPWIPKIQTRCLPDRREYGVLKTTGKSGDQCLRTSTVARSQQSKLLPRIRSESMWAPKTADSSAVWTVGTDGAQTLLALPCPVTQSRESIRQQSSAPTFSSSQLRTLGTPTSFAQETAGRLGKTQIKVSFPMFRITLL